MATRPRPVVWSQSAQRELEEVLAHVAKDSPSGAQSIAHRTLEAAGSLSTLSERGRIVPEINDPLVRETFVYAYRLLYRVAETRITILAFIHGARDFERWRREEQ
ncbi:MAG TPA: type II toxin-antitoxin system RelE/ParE family toxin [Candidatus Limnocylindrales bacterium]|nr:type II toxin-antitoxin system RelE/ParE family toxin [Candidatus Limnocylindrales bacterium]